MHTAVPSAGNSDPEPLQIDIGIKEVAALTTEEKLQHFEDICTGDALKKYEQAVSDYTAYEEKILNEHKENARKQAALQIAAEKERIARETNKNLSLGRSRSAVPIAEKMRNSAEKSSPSFATGWRGSWRPRNMTHS